MKNALRVLLSSVMLIALFAGMQTAAFATLLTTDADEVSRYENDALPGTARAAEADERNDVSAVDQNGNRLPDVGTNEIDPISANPDTGAGSLAIPAIVALLAASTSAITLSAKKRR